MVLGAHRIAGPVKLYSGVMTYGLCPLPATRPLAA